MFPCELFEYLSPSFIIESREREGGGEGEGGERERTQKPCQLVAMAVAGRQDGFGSFVLIIIILFLSLSLSSIALSTFSYIGCIFVSFHFTPELSLTMGPSSSNISHMGATCTH